jgi:hypothetical protein
MIPMLPAHIDMLTTILGMSLDLLEDIVVVRLHGIGSLGLFLVLAGFSLLLLLA